MWHFAAVVLCLPFVVFCVVLCGDEFSFGVADAFGDYLWFVVVLVVLLFFNDAFDEFFGVFGVVYAEVAVEA